ncbi:hypothetical protein ATCC90586_010876 [Pythium insidiosum]|nr:hypothetical protein ATCC90586_010876 [Pythium insidiosum]
MGNTKAIVAKSFPGSNDLNVAATATWLGVDTRRLEISARWPRTIDAVRELYHLDRWVVPDLETQVSDAREITVKAGATAGGVDRRLYSMIEEMTPLRQSHKSYVAQFREMRELLQQSGVVQRAAPPAKRRRVRKYQSLPARITRNGVKPVDVCLVFFNANSANGSISLQERDDIA